MQSVTDTQTAKYLDLRMSDPDAYRHRGERP